ncbi:MAG: hydrogenase maturation nickel metallochaperone HypA [Candidatus Acidiferrales bacterium]|jgi:hydrogenase nickel incorporation protein HypA/HybF
MHELSIAMSIVEMAEEESQRNGGLRVTSVHLRLGTLAGVVKTALLSSYELASEQSSVNGSKLVIEDVPGVVFCSACNARRPVSESEWFRCSTCGSLASELVSGKELEVVSLEVEE